jgi:aryl-alcohol dehydrogenase-like predicted oxidoreductase
MELKELGDSGVMVPEIGVGTWKYTGGIEPLRRGLHWALFLLIQQKCTALRTW